MHRRPNAPSLDAQLLAKERITRALLAASSPLSLLALADLTGQAVNSDFLGCCAQLALSGYLRFAERGVEATDKARLLGHYVATRGESE